MGMAYSPASVPMKYSIQAYQSITYLIVFPYGSLKSLTSVGFIVPNMLSVFAKYSIKILFITFEIFLAPAFSLSAW